jgi:hypothetical protein
MVLQPCQRVGLIDELEELNGPMREAFDAARDRWKDLLSLKAGEPLHEATLAEATLESKAYALRVVAAIQSQVPAGVTEEPFEIVGPATMVSNLIEGAVRNAADRLGESLRSPSRPNAQTRGRLRELAVAVCAWVETYVDCQAVEWYSFDPNWDHVPSPGGV